MLTTETTNVNSEETGGVDVRDTGGVVGGLRGGQEKKKKSQTKIELQIWGFWGENVSPRK